MSIRSLLVEEVESQMGEVSRMEAGSEVSTTTINNVCKLVDKINEIDKIEIDRLDKVEKFFFFFFLLWI